VVVDVPVRVLHAALISSATAPRPRAGHDRGVPAAAPRWSRPARSWPEGRCSQPFSPGCSYPEPGPQRCRVGASVPRSSRVVLEHRTSRPRDVRGVRRGSTRRDL